ncbi:hypothetical protein IW140_000637 [Coemansia sp. RSA 1813]|nr:hypothetical protein EV178_003341 [Coemansia sp. RSA 1646]KAJ1774105.1 hypothetical protein LPJ74_000204 [Coemansia sp. RSA 1843]KAJ2092503.1 hypothetical protein IW138_000941 [Coemansia sp. RSA 986]KAJ2216802.1 hypothetical protein EV179_001092 [Coemansia sp. RSA 487]KAJ2572874.1 hypothetical protein IW140_000637 [Coemansia sp. RSA 1813]
MASIPTVEIGVPGDKVRVPRIGLGTMGMSAVFGPTNDDESIKVLERAIDIGCTFWNTACAYGIGHNERLLSRVLKDRRDKVFVSTKFGIMLREPEDDPPKFFAHYMIGHNGKRDYVRECINKTLERLGTDYVDLYIIARIDRSTPLEETIGALGELVKEGKIRYIGISECTADDLRRAYKVHPIAAAEVEYSVWSRDIEADGLLDACRDLGVTIIAYSPLGHGFLTGRVRNTDELDKDDVRSNLDRLQPEHFDANLRFVDSFGRLAKKHNATAGQLALAWLLRQEENLIAIPGTKKIKYLEENFGAGQIELSDAELKELRNVVNNADIQGHRLWKEHS